jgi:hypothetical protein
VIRRLNDEELPDVRVYPSQLHIGDIEGDIWGKNAVQFKPLGYAVNVSIGGYAICKIVEWAIRNGILVLNGEIYYKYKKHMKRIVRSG